MTTKLSIDLKEFLDKTSTKEFLSAARQFVDILEIKTIDQEEFYRQVHRALAELYAAGHKLEWIELKYSDAEKNYDNDEVVNKNENKISELGGEAFYWEIFDPSYTTDDKEATQGWLVDDFGDIYNDLKTDLDKLDNHGTDEFVEDALWQMKWGYYHHWGNHCINALRALHFLWYDGKLKNESTVPNNR